MKRVSAEGMAFSPEWATVDSKGRSVVGGWFRTASNSGDTIFVARTLASGAVDTSFGTGGLARISDGFALLRDHNRDSFALDAKDRIVVVARRKLTATSVSNVDTFAARIAENGSLDGAFGAGGIVSGLVSVTQTATTAASSLAVATVGTSTFVYTITPRTDVLEENIVGVRLDEAGTRLPYDFTIPVGTSARLDGVRVAAGGGGLFVGNRWRIYKLTAAGTIDASFGTSGYVDEPHGFVSSLRDGSLVIAKGLSFKILPPTGHGTAVQVTAEELDTLHPLKSIVERCDGTLVTAAGDDKTSDTVSVVLLGADGKSVAGHPRVTFPANSFHSEMQAAIDPSTGTVMYFGIGDVNADKWLSAARVHP
jgi:hypothetical protein